MIGKKFGRLTILRISKEKHDRRGAFFVCRCACGNECTVRRDGLTSGHAKSCGCLQREAATKNCLKRTIHGDCRRGKRTKEFRSFCSAKDRCSNPNIKDWHRYGGRGIKFLFVSFKQFLSHIGRMPHPGLTLDRINNEGHYEIGNVRWATHSEQCRNRRKMKVSKRMLAALRINIKKAQEALRLKRLRSQSL
jgi:hypothetical protein